MFLHLFSMASLNVLQVKEVAPEARRRDATLSFAFVYPDKRGRFVVREVSFCCHTIVGLHNSPPFVSW